VARFKFEEALQLHEQALELRKTLDSSHPDLAESHGKRAFVLRRLHRNDQARQEFDETLAIYRMFFDDSHPRVAQTLRWKATVLADSGRFPEALTILHDIVKMQRAQAAAARPPRQPGQPDPEQETMLRELARVYLMMGKYEKAADFAEQALGKAVSGKEAASAVMSARVLLRLGKLAEAQAAAEKAQQSSRKLLGSQSPDFADATYWLASVLAEQGDIGNALELQTEALAVREKLSDPLDYANSLIAVGTLLTRTRQAAQGLVRIEQAFQVLHSSGGTKSGFSYLRRHVGADAKVAKAAALFELAHHRVTPEILRLRSEAETTYSDPRTPDPWSQERLESPPKKHSRHKRSAK
jgi:tetratricopeptide (TPR) repeat protein